MAEINALKYGESVLVYESVRAGEPWPAGFWAPTNCNRRISEILTYVIKGVLKIETYEAAKQVVDAAFIDEYELSGLVEMAERPPEMQDGEFFYLLWYVFPEKQMTQEELIRKVYDEVLSGQRKCFPRGYFVRGGNVEYKAQVCFRHLCELFSVSSLIGALLTPSLKVGYSGNTGSSLITIAFPISALFISHRLLCFFYDSNMKAV